MKNLFIIMLLSLFINNLNAADVKLLKSFNKGNATINTYNVGNTTTIHSFIDSFVYAYIIETDNNLILVDTLNNKDSATALLNFALTLNKQIYGVFLTHSHPDHIGGVEALAQYKMYALADTKSDVKTKFNNDFNIKVINVGDEFKVDNIVLKADNIANAHINSHLILMIPQINTIVVGDLVVKDFVKQHLLIRDFDAFLAGLEYLKSQADYDNLLTGHTEIVSTKVLPDNITYVKTGKTQYDKSSSPEDYVKRMHQFYPSNSSDEWQIKFLTK